MKPEDADAISIEHAHDCHGDDGKTENVTSL